VKIAVMGFLIVTIFLSANGTIANAQNSAATAPKLMFTVILTRHGVRSPTWTLPVLNEYSAEPWPDWGVAPGKLTPRGRELMTLFGSYYRLYFAAAGLLPSTGCEDAVTFVSWRTQNRVPATPAMLWLWESCQAAGYVHRPSVTEKIRSLVRSLPVSAIQTVPWQPLPYLAGSAASRTPW
jgi:hypothetical protein